MAKGNLAASLLRLFLLYTSLSCVHLRRLRSGNMHVLHILYSWLTTREQRENIFSLLSEVRGFASSPC